MEPNDLPIVCLPLNLPDASAASLLEFFHELTDALERHYAGQLHRHYQDQRAKHRQRHDPDDPPESDPPF